jgi:hypothetical protein
MQITKSSTSNEPNYKAMLDELLAVVHRDGGQYTILVGYDLSIKDAVLKIQFARHNTPRLKR